VITRTDEIKSQYSIGAKPKAAKQSDDVRGVFFSITDSVHQRGARSHA
jgi:hypothetical protein